MASASQKSANSGKATLVRSLLSWIAMERPPPGTPFTIVDPLGRTRFDPSTLGSCPPEGCVIIFYPHGSPVNVGTWADNVMFSADGTTATGTVPGTFDPRPHGVAVRPTPTEDSVFGDFAFLSTL
jgi:hypothetical protein